MRETPVSGYSLLYPALIAPAYGAFDDLVDAYGAAKATNAVVMSLAAIPTYLLARRVTGMWLALLGAVIAVAVPSMAYTGTMTTESLFYPVALGFAVVLRPLPRAPRLRVARRARRRAARVAFATRSQSLAFVPAIATAPLLLALFAREPGALRPFAPLYVLGAAAALGLVVLQAVRGQSLADLLGAYSIVGEGGYDVEQRPALLALARRGARPVRRDRPLRRAPPLRPARSHPLGAPAGAPRRDDGAPRLVDARGRRVRVSLRVGPRPGPLPLLPRAAPRGVRARVGGARGASSRAATAAAAAAALALVLVFPYVSSSASRRSRTRSG